MEVVELWKLKSTYHFAENLVHFVLKIECCLTVLSNFETEEALEDSAFWKVDNSFIYRLIINSQNRWRTWGLRWRGVSVGQGEIWQAWQGKQGNVRDGVL